ARGDLGDRRPQRGVVAEPLPIGAAHPLVTVDVGRPLARQVELVLTRPDLGGAADAGVRWTVVLRESRAGRDTDDGREEAERQTDAGELLHAVQRTPLAI